MAESVEPFVGARWQASGLLGSRHRLTANGVDLLSWRPAHFRRHVRALGEALGQPWRLEQTRIDGAGYRFRFLEGAGKGTLLLAEFAIPSFSYLECRIEDTTGHDYIWRRDRVTHKYSLLAPDGSPALSSGAFGRLQIGHAAPDEAGLPWLVLLYSMLPWLMAPKGEAPVI